MAEQSPTPKRPRVADLDGQEGGEDGKSGPKEESVMDELMTSTWVAHLLQMSPPHPFGSEQSVKAIAPNPKEKEEKMEKKATKDKEEMKEKKDKKDKTKEKEEMEKSMKHHEKQFEKEKDEME